MDSILANINKKISNLRQNYEKMQSELCVSRQVSSKLGEQIVSLEWQCWRNCQYSRRECLAVSGLPQSMENSRTGRHSFQVAFKKLDVEIGSSNIEDWHGPKRVILEFFNEKTQTVFEGSRRTLRAWIYLQLVLDLRCI